MKKGNVFSDILSLENVRVLLFFVFVFIISLLYIYMSEDMDMYGKNAGYQVGNVYEGKGIVTSFTDKGTYAEITVVPKEKRSYIAEMKLMLRIYKNEFIGDLPDSTYINSLCWFRFIYEPLDTEANYGNFDSKEYYNSLGIAGVFQCEEIIKLKSNFTLYTYIMNAKLYMEANIYKYMGDKYGSIMSAMVLGNKYAMDTDTKELYKRNGLAHILAVSGLHIATVGILLYNFLRKFMSVKTGAAVSSVIMLLYGILTGGSVSCIRAVIMFIMKQGSLITGRKYNIYNSILISAIIILLLNPFFIRNSSFIMSYVAIISITVIMPEISYILGKLKNKYIDLFMPLITGFIFNVIMLPLVCLYYYEISLLSVFLNLLIVPLMTVVLLTGLLCGLTGGIFEVSGYVSGWIGKFFLIVFEKLCDVVEVIPKTMLVTGKPQLKEVIVFYLMVFLLFLILRWVRIVIRRKEAFKLRQVMFIGMMAVTLVMFCASFISVVRNKHMTGNELFVSFIDVGQGDSIFIKDNKGTSYLVDCGSSSVSNVGKYRVSSHLKALGIDSVDYVFITHGDADHTSGIKEILSDRYLMKVENLVVAECQKEDEAIKDLIGLACKSYSSDDIIYIHAGMTFNSGDLYIECLYPDSGLHTDNINEKSVVLKVGYRDYKMLLTGDIGSDTEKILVKKWSEEIKDIDILKVAHHGSKNSSSTEFLEITNPCIAIISCGEENMYGHPSPETLQRLNEVGATTLATMDEGGIMLKIDDKIRVY